ncbi:MAG: glycosyltransferase family 39 protein [Reyranella sp.]|nr:glycosyltransferase family 39 protein [Reyranella sp.]MDP3161485.1 glycosyltransferase family 39 protein [Reyranella sp.]
MADLRTRRRLEAAGLAVVLAIAAVLRLWRLEDNGFGTEYYAAGVRSMLQGGWLFFYNAFDPAGFISLDKPPIAFWIQTGFASLLGFSGWTIHLPQALAGVASVAILHRLVRRPFGIAAGLTAALLLAITPIAVAIDRSNNADSWLVFFLLLAAVLAARGRGLSFVLAMVLLGVAFNVKMLAALVCGPALAAAYLAAAPFDWRRHLIWLSAGAAALIVVGLSWAVAFDLTPRDHRPYAGSSTGNSMLELIVQHNGLDRFVRPEAAAPSATPSAPRYDGVPVGVLRLAQPMLAGQFAWMLPLAVLGAVLAWRRRRAAVVLWGTWALAYGIVYSTAGGIFHLYYLATLAPPLAALAAIGGIELWRRGSRHLAVGLAVTALWQAYLVGLSLGWDAPWIGFPAVGLLAGAAVLWRDKRPPALIGGVALLVLPVAWATSAIFSPGNLTLPSASLPRWLGLDDGRGPVLSHNFRPLTDDPKLRAFLQEHRGRARFLAAAPNALLAAPLIVRTGAPALAFGGYLGNDPVMSVDAFAKRVENGDVRFVVLGTARRSRGFEAWVRAHGVPVDPVLWRSLPQEPRRTIALYDLAPPR